VNPLTVVEITKTTERTY